MATRKTLLDAAEQIVREQGAASLTVRSLAARTNFGKSTVHEAIGSMDALWAELRTRAVTECLETVEPTTASPTDPAALAAMHKLLGVWVVDNPDWALLAFSAPDAEWEPPPDGNASAMLSFAGNGSMLDLGPDRLEALARFACALMAAAARLVIAVGDAELAVPTFGATHTALAGAVNTLAGPNYGDGGSSLPEATKRQASSGSG